MVMPLAALPVAVPVRQVVVLEVEERVADPDLVQRAIAQHLCQLAERLVVVFRRRIRRGGMLLVADPERFPETPGGHLPHQAGLRRELIVARAPPSLAVRPLEIDVEFRVGRVPDAGPRLSLVLVVPEEVQLVLHDRATERRAELLIVEG